LDVHATRDGVVVIHHDPEVGAIFGGLHGQPIAELDWEALPDSGATSGGPIPTLAQLLAIVPPVATAYVEIKGRDIERLVAEVILASTARCAVHSFDHRAIQRMHEIAPEIPRGILFDHRPESVVAAMAATNARDVWPEWRLIDQSLVEQVHEAGGRIIAWTVNNRHVAKGLIERGVDGLCTDDLRLLDGL
jgi:glycerophosphoryl diester phosphodiesterase